MSKALLVVISPALGYVRFTSEETPTVRQHTRAFYSLSTSLQLPISLALLFLVQKFNLYGSGSRACTTVSQ